MHLRAPLAVLLVGAIATLPSPASAGAVTIHRHITVERIVGHEADGPLTTPKETVRVVRLKPPDSDDDGVADGDDRCPQTAAATEDGCPAPAPAPVVPTSAPTTAPRVTTSGANAIPSYISDCESGGDYGAYNPSSGATGKYQILPSTAAAYGCDLSTPAGQDACAGAIYADVGSSAWSCG